MTKNRNEILSITSGPRQSNFELVRILAMFMVLGLHFNFKYLGLPHFSQENVSDTEILYCGCRCILESICLPAVNIFILISGWFTIRPSYIKLFGYLFQCYFFLTITYIAFCMIFKIPFSIEGFASCMALTKYGWFIISYLILYIISPILNGFLHSSRKVDLQKCIFLYFAVSILYGWIGNNSNYANGYSAVAFIGLYILGYYVKSYVNKRLRWGAFFLIVTIINSCCLIVDIIFFESLGVSRILSYLNPLVIVQAITLLMYFSSLHIPQQKIINFVAKSAFAVYLIHDCSKYQEVCISRIIYFIQNNVEGINLFLYLFLLVIIIYSTAILLDQVRIKIWKIIQSNLNSENYSKYLY